MTRYLLVLTVAAAVAGVGFAGRLEGDARVGGREGGGSRYLAFVSNGVRPIGENALILFDRQAGKLVALPDLARRGSIGHAALSGGARLIAYSLIRTDSSGGGSVDLAVYDRIGGRQLTLPGLNGPALELHPSLSADGRLLAFWSTPNERLLDEPDADIALYDLANQRRVPLPGLNSKKPDTHPSLSPEGRYLAFTTQREKQTMRQDVYLYDLRARKLVPLPGLNKANEDEHPSLSRDARWIAFASNRGDVLGGYDILLYDRASSESVPLPGLNTASDETQPSISECGRWIVFSSNRPGGTGETDLYLYDRRQKKTNVLTPCNSKGLESMPALSPEGPAVRASRSR